MVQNLAEQLQLMLVTDDRLLKGKDVLRVCQEAVAGGVTIVQLRLKACADREFLALARLLVGRLTVPVIINDRVDIALLAGAAGVHLGADDMAPSIARRMVPDGFLIGASVGSEAEAVRGMTADYWGIGPLHATATKPDAGAALGWEGVAALVPLGGSRPMVVIGGVRPEDVPLAKRHRLSGVAVVSGILSADNLTAAAAAYGRQSNDGG